jgi:hypothetical protein
MESRRVPHTVTPRPLAFVARCFQKLAWLAVLLAPAHGQTVPTGPIPATFFGLHFIHPASPWPVVDFGTRRFWDTGTRWAQLQANTSTTSPTWNWSPLDAWLNGMHAHGLSDAMYNLGGQTPDWLASGSDPACDYNPGGCYPPKDIAASCTNADGTKTCDGKADGTDLGWRQWVAAMASHIKNAGTGVHIAAYEIWNEFGRRTGTGDSSYAWVGSNAQMVRLAEDSRCIIAGRGAVTATGETCAQVLRSVGLSSPVDPTALILSGSGGMYGQKKTNFYSYMSTPGAEAATEAIAVHLYPQPVTGETSASDFRTFVSGLNPLDRAKAFWATEGGFGTTTELTDPDQQAAFVARYYLTLQSAGLVRAYWYAYDNGAWGAMWLANGDNNKTGDSNQITCNELKAPYGLGAGQGCLLLTGTAYQQIYRWLVGNTLTTPCSAKGTVYTCGFTKPDGSQLLAVWDVSQKCSQGVCTYSNYAQDPKYTQYFDLNSPTPHGISGSPVQIGAKPILLQGAASPATTISAAGATLTYSPASQNVSLTATVTSASGMVNGGTVVFTVSKVGSATSGAVSGGRASALLPVPAGTPVAGYAIQAVYSGAAGFAGSSDNTKLLTIQKATPVITWANPSDILAGTPLGPAQLNAAASVPGAFLYSPQAGAVLPPGAQQTLSAAFTPADTADYTAATKTVQINVKNPPDPCAGRYRPGNGCRP